MGFRVRKSFKIFPGVRMTVTPNGFSTTLGVGPAHVNVHSSGRVTGTMDLPGSGVSYTKQTSLKKLRTKVRGGAPAPRKAPAVDAQQARPEPGLFAPRWEKRLFAALAEKRYDRIAAIGERYDDARPSTAVLVSVLVAHPAGDMATVLEQLSWLRSTGRTVADDEFIQKYVDHGELSVHVATGVDATLPLGPEILDLLLVEAYQDCGRLEDAIALAEDLEPSTLAAVSLAELYIIAGRFADVIDLSNGLVNEDEAATYLLVQRAAALREQGLLDASIETIREALRPRSRPAELRNAAYLERARTYIAQDKPGMARKDLERVLAADARIPGVRELLDSLAPAPAE
ncbi:MAG: DUF4236 domain-containing protein [Nocardioides sp.]|nr:DUF4236 domain-containing protein [Nocardioides sp.]